MGKHFKDPWTWFVGLLWAGIGGFFGALESGLVLPALDHEAFNYGERLHKTLLGIGIFSFLSAVKVTAGYLKDKPLPAIEVTDTVFIEKDK
jgi:hypothetical protein